MRGELAELATIRAHLGSRKREPALGECPGDIQSCAELRQYPRRLSGASWPSRGYSRETRALPAAESASQDGPRRRFPAPLSK